MRRYAFLILTSEMLGPCSKKEPAPPPPLASQPEPPATKQSAPPLATTPPPASSADLAAAADRAALETAKSQVSDLEWCVAHNALKDPAKPDDDAVAKCASIDGARPRLSVMAQPEVKKMLDEAKRLCSFDIPLISANDALKQSVLSPSQASRRMTCGFAAKDLAQARSVHPDDKRFKELDARYKRTCQ